MKDSGGSAAWLEPRTFEKNYQYSRKVTNKLDGRRAAEFGAAPPAASANVLLGLTSVFVLARVVEKLRFKCTAS